MPEVPNIALRAYQLWDAAGRPEDRSEEFYFQAEEELRKLLEIDPQDAADKSA
jgi:Protein of unknown function (DUF2934)